MKINGLLVGTLVVSVMQVSAVQAETKQKIDGKSSFEKHCASCHRDGGNIINPAKSIKKSDLAKAGIANTRDIVAKMRKPGPGMTAFSKKDVSDREAKAIAEYMLKSFK